MEMSSAYMAQTVAHLKSAGYQVTEHAESKMRDGAPIYDRVRYVCRKPPGVDLALEVLTYPDGRETYFLEFDKVGPIRSYSFPLDSWKYRPTSVEFKYYVHPESGLGLSFVLDLLPALPGSS